MNSFKLTQEQIDIIDAIVNRDEHMVIVDSGAGASKSTTTMHALHDKDIKYRDGMILSFGASIAKENAKHVPSWVKSKTIHALAYGHIMPRGSRLEEIEVEEFATIKGIGSKKFAKYLINRFCSSSFLSVDDFINNEAKERGKDLDSFKDPISNLIMSRASEGRYFHGLYIKLFHKKLASKELVVKTDILVVDEFADCSGVLYEVSILIEAEKKVLIGDCVDEKTKIETDNGWMMIKNMYKQYTDGQSLRVKSLNESTGKFEYKPVVNIVKTGYKEMFNVIMNKNRIITTKDHRFLTDEGYKRLHEIKSGDLIRSSVYHSNSSYRKIDQEQEQVFFGSFLGDGSINRFSNKVYRIAMGHGEKQKEYLKWKMSFFRDDGRLSFKKRGAEEINGKKFIARNSYSVSTTKFISEFGNLSFDDVIENITDLGIAIWIMDDGSIVSRNKKDNSIQGLRISSNAFTEKENHKLLNMINERYDTDGYVRCSKGKYYEIQFRKKDSNKILNILGEYIHDDFLGKFKESKSIYVPNVNQSNETYFIVEEITSAGTSMAYDMEVEDNHNFVASKTSTKKDNASGIVVHNCNQSIMGFSGSINGLQKAIDTSDPEDTIILNLTKTFRCSVEIARGVQSYMRLYSSEKKFSFVGHDHDERKYETFTYQTRTNGELIKALLTIKRLGLTPAFTRPLKSIFSKYLAVAAFDKKMEIEYTKDDKELFDREYNIMYQAYKEASEMANADDRSVMSVISERLNPSSKQYDKDLEEEYGFIKGVLTIGTGTIVDIYKFCKESEEKDDKDLLTTSVHSYKGSTSDVTYLSDGISKKAIEEFENNFEIKEHNKSLPQNKQIPLDYDECMCAYVAVTRARHTVINAGSIVDIPSCEELEEKDFFDMVMASKRNIKELK